MLYLEWTKDTNQKVTNPFLATLKYK